MRRIFLTALFLLPTTAFAMQQTVWDFRGGQVPVKLKVAGLDAPTATAEGLHLTASQQDGSLIAEMSLQDVPNVLSITLLTAHPTEAKVIWHRRDAPEGVMTQLPIAIPASLNDSPINISMDTFPEWSTGADEIGFTFPKGADVVLRDIVFVHWNLLEQAEEAWRGFWTFDHYLPYSINFVWGPLLSRNPVATADLFSSLPPRARSANWIFYALLLIAGIGLAGHRIARRWKASPSPLMHLRIGNAAPELVALLLCFGALWIFYDIRMGLEMLQYAHTDYSTYISQEPGDRNFRSYLNFYAVEEQSQSATRGEKEYAFLQPQQMPFLSMMRYFTYPALPIAPESPRPDLHTWIVFARDDITVGADGRLTVNGNPLSQPGTIIKQFNDSSFLFQTNE